MNKAVIYARVGTKREEQQNSLKNQIAYGYDLAKQNGFSVVRTYVDNSLTGQTLQNREAILQLLVDAQKKKFDVIIAKSVSRLGRNSIESL